MCFFCLEKMQQNNTDPAVLNDFFLIYERKREIFKTYYSSLAWERKDDIIYLFLKLHMSKHKVILIAGWKKYLNSVTTS